MWETQSVFHISMPRLLRQDGLWCWRPIAQRRVRPFRVVFHPPPLRQNLCLLQRVKDLAIQKLIAQLPVETLAVPVLPRTPRLDVQRPGAQLAQPLPQLPGNELRPIVRTNVLRYSSPAECKMSGISLRLVSACCRHFRFLQSLYYIGMALRVVRCPASSSPVSEQALQPGNPNLIRMLLFP